MLDDLEVVGIVEITNSPGTHHHVRELLGRMRGASDTELADLEGRSGRRNVLTERGANTFVRFLFLLLGGDVLRAGVVGMDGGHLADRRAAANDHCLEIVLSVRRRTISKKSCRGGIGTKLLIIIIISIIIIVCFCNLKLSVVLLIISSGTNCCRCGTTGSILLLLLRLSRRVKAIHQRI